jgi:hypothetical protein
MRKILSISHPFLWSAAFGQLAQWDRYPARTSYSGWGPWPTSTMRPVATITFTGSGSQGIGRPAFVTTQMMSAPHEEQVFTS